MRQSTVLVVDDEKEIADFIERMKIIMYLNFTMEKMHLHV